MGDEDDGGMAKDREDALMACEALTKLMRGDLHQITIEDTQALFDVLDVSDRGELSTEDLRVLRTLDDLALTDDDIEGMIADCTKDGSGKVSLESLYGAFHQGTLVERAVMEELGQGPKVYNKHECTRDELLEFLEFENETMDALCSLPITMLAFVLFFVLVQFHLSVGSAYQMQSAIFDEVEGEGMPFIGTYIHDVPSFYEWMTTSFVSAQFKSSGDKLKQYPYPGRFVVYNQIIGGMQIVKTQSATLSTDCDQGDILAGFYDTLGPGRCHKGGESNTTSEFLLYHVKADEIINQIKTWDTLDYVDANTRNLDFTNLYYNAHLGAFTEFHLTFDWNPSGNVKVMYGMESWVANPYGGKMWLIVIDIVYIIILARMTYAELMEMLPRLLNGLDGFIQYWEFWNLVDWLNIAFGSVFFALWFMICEENAGPLHEAILALPTKKLDTWVISNTSYMMPDELNDYVVGGTARYTEQIAHVHQVAAGIAATHGNLRTVTFFYTFTLMLKFFKSFQANPRLNIVVMTMTSAAVDIIHFFIVFMTIFCVFSLMASLIFGPKMIEFSTQMRAFFYCWRILLGEWDLEPMEGVDYYFANIWFNAFQIMVMMILLNIMLAIIMDTYSGVVGIGGDVTIWEQTRLAVNTVRETRGHIDLLYLRCEMEDEDAMSHPGERVSSKSLRKAFEGDKMTRANADYLVRKTVEWMEEREEECELKMHDAIKLIAQTKTAVLKISGDTHKTLDMLKAAERAPTDARHDAIMAGYDPDDPHSMAQMQAAMDGGDDMGKPAPSSVGQAQQDMSMMGGGMMGGGMMGGGMMGGMQNNMSMMGGMGGMPQDMSMMGMSGGHPMGVPEMQQNLPMQLSNSYQNQGQTGGFQPNGTMSTMGGSMGMQQGGPMGFNNQQPMAMQSMQQGAGGPGMNQLMEKMQQMQAKMSQMQEMMGDQRDYIERRDAWLETRASQLDRRFQKVEVLSDRLYAMVRSFEGTDLGAVPREVKKALDMHMDTVRSGGVSPGGQMALRDASMESNDFPSPPAGNAEPFDMFDDMAPTPSSPPTNRQQMSSSGAVVPHGDSGRIDGIVKDIKHSMETLNHHAQSTPQITRMLWRMDLNLRQLTGTANNLPNNGNAATNSSGAPSASRSKSTTNARDSSKA